MNELRAIDFFCSGGGMTNGLVQSGIRVIAGIDNDPSVRETYERNNKGTKFLEKDVFSLKESDLQSELNLKIGDDNLVFVGCSPCQYWSIIKTDKTKSSKTKDLLKEFQRFVLYFNPGFVIVENVPGLERKATESGLQDFIDDLESKGYVVSAGLYKLNEYGVPQTRKRFSLIASRVVKQRLVPEKSKKGMVVRDVIGVHNGFQKINAGFRDSTEFQHSAANLNIDNLEIINRTPINGGNSIKPRFKFTGSGFGDSYSRMSWDKPSPTITTKFYSFSNGRFGHPDENRALSLREGACLQTFPKSYVFHSNSMAIIARMIGNAVPPEFAKRIGETILKASVSEST